jgi:hypothetical protein
MIVQSNALVKQGRPVCWVAITVTTLVVVVQEAVTPQQVVVGDSLKDATTPTIVDISSMVTVPVVPVAMSKRTTATL